MRTTFSMMVVLPLLDDAATKETIFMNSFSLPWIEAPRSKLQGIFDPQGSFVILIAR
jgi:hypothetical protein